MDTPSKAHQWLHALITRLWHAGQTNLLPGTAGKVTFGMEALEGRAMLSGVGAQGRVQEEEATGAFFMIPFWEVASVQGIPSVPLEVTASDGTYRTMIRVTWLPVVHATGYEVWRNSINNLSTAQQVAHVTEPVFENGAVEADKPYFYWVKAKSRAGTSRFSAGDVGYRTAPMTLPAVLHMPRTPGEVSASKGEFTTQVSVRWPIVADAASYEIWRGTSTDLENATKLSDVTANVYEDTGTRPLRLYRYWVRAKNSAGVSGFSPVDAGYRLSVPTPLAPTEVTASDGIHANQVRVAWNPSAGATAYEVWRGTCDDANAAVKWTDVEGTVFENTSVETGVIYYYWVKAKNEAGVSVLSGVAVGWRG